MNDETSAPERSLALLTFLVIFNVILSTSFQDALFLSHHERSSIPKVMFLGSLVTALTTIGLLPMLRRRSAAASLRVILLGLGLVSLLCAAWNFNPDGPSTLFLFLFVELSTTLGAAAMWTYVQAPLTPPQVRRLVPRLGICGALGGLLAGSIVPLILHRTSQPQVLVAVSALSWLAPIPLVRSTHVQQVSGARHGRGRVPGGIGQVLRAPLLPWLALGAAGLIWAGLLVQYETRVALQHTLTPAGIARTMALLLAAASLFGIVTQALITTPILERFGVAVAMALLPVSMSALLSTYLVLPGLNIIATVFVIDKTMRPNLQRPAESCLVAALPPALRPGVFMVMGGILTPLLKALGALGLCAFATLVPPPYIGKAALLLTLGLIVLSLRWGALYRRTLRQTLEGGNLDVPAATLGETAFVPLIDGPRLSMLLSAIETGSWRSRALALELLRPHRADLVRRAMYERLQHPELHVRIAALRWLQDEPSQLLQDHLQKRWAQDPVPTGERIALLEAAGARAPELLGQDAERYLSAPELDLRLEVLRVLLRSVRGPDLRLAGSAIETLLHSPAAQGRSAALELIRELKLASFLPAVREALRDPEVQVRRQVIACLPALPDPDAPALLLAALSDRRQVHAAVRALIACGERIVPDLLAALPHTPPSSHSGTTRLHLLRILGAISYQQTPGQVLGQATFGLLDFLDPEPALDTPPKTSAGPTAKPTPTTLIDHQAQLEALRSLNKLRRRHRGLQLSAERLRRIVLVDLCWGLRLLQAQDLLSRRLPQRGLLLRELAAQIDSTQERASRTLALLSPPNTMVHIFRALRAESSPLRDQARELLRTVLRGGPLLLGSLKLLDEEGPWPQECFQPPLSVPVRPNMNEVLCWLRDSGDPWLVAALRHDRQGHRLKLLVEPAADPADPSPPEDPMQPSLDLILFLKDVALFQELTNQQLAEVAYLAEKVELQKGVVLFHQDDPPDYIYVIREGKVQVTIGDREVARLGPGECAGEIGVLCGSNRSGSVSTLMPCQLLRFEGDDFLSLLSNYPEIGRALLRSLARRLERAGNQAKDRATITGMVARETREEHR